MHGIDQTRFPIRKQEVEVPFLRELMVNKPVFLFKKKKERKDLNT